MPSRRNKSPNCSIFSKPIAIFDKTYCQSHHEIFEIFASYIERFQLQVAIWRQRWSLPFFKYFMFSNLKLRVRSIFIDIIVDILLCQSCSTLFVVCYFNTHSTHILFTLFVHEFQMLAQLSTPFLDIQTQFLCCVPIKKIGWKVQPNFRIATNVNLFDCIVFAFRMHWIICHGMNKIGCSMKRCD